MLILIALSTVWVDDLEISSNGSTIFVRQQWTFFTRLREVPIADILCSCVSQSVDSEEYRLASLLLFARLQNPKPQVKRIAIHHLLSEEQVYALQNSLEHEFGILPVRNIRYRSHGKD